jgi:hypothetical protein
MNTLSRVTDRYISPVITSVPANWINVNPVTIISTPTASSAMSFMASSKATVNRLIWLQEPLSFFGQPADPQPKPILCQLPAHRSRSVRILHTAGVASYSAEIAAKTATLPDPNTRTLCGSVVDSVDLHDRLP